MQLTVYTGCVDVYMQCLLLVECNELFKIHICDHMV